MFIFRNALKKTKQSHKHTQHINNNSTYTLIFHWKIFLVDSKISHQFDSTMPVIEQAITSPHHEECFRQQKEIQKIFEAKIKQIDRDNYKISSFFGKGSSLKIISMDDFSRRK